MKTGLQIDELSRTLSLKYAKQGEERPDMRRCCESCRNPRRGACERSSLKIDLGSPRCLLPAGKLEIRVSRGTICLRHVPFCRLFSSRKQIRTPAGSPCHRRSATLHKPVMIDRLESKLSAGRLFKQPLLGLLFFCFFVIPITAKEKQH